MGRIARHVFCLVAKLEIKTVDKLVKSPLTLWTTAKLKLKDHEMKSPMHKCAVLKAEAFEKVMKNDTTPIDLQLKSALATQVAENRQKLIPIVKTVIFCGRRNFALRGHREGETSKNRGNFRALLDFRVDSGDSILKKHLETASKTAMYISKTIQNELITIIGGYIQYKIVQDVKNGSGVFSVIADESRDCSNQEQMPIIVRYVDEHRVIQEIFISFVKCDQGTAGEKIAELITSTCEVNGLDFSLCRGQGYDGAGNMAGIAKGASTLIRSDYPKALYFHCASHKLNLCVAHSCNLTSISNMMSSISALSNFFRSYFIGWNSFRT